MSGSYAERLTPGVWRGTCGLREYEESTIDAKAKKIAELIRNATYTVVLTGAGISTSCGIPDFRGPNGVWTREERGEAPPTGKSFDSAEPSFTHRMLVQLARKGLLHFLISQNVDGLHMRSGFPREQLAELHGNVFAEVCSECKKEFIRNFDVQGMGCKPTGRSCEACGGELRDNVLDWFDELPQQELDAAIEHSCKADLMICLGTSLQIEPTMHLPWRTLRKCEQHGKKKGGKLVIVNLQKTKKDRYAAVHVHAKCDAVMDAVARFLEIKVPLSSVSGDMQEEITECGRDNAMFHGAKRQRVAERSSGGSAMDGDGAARGFPLDALDAVSPLPKRPRNDPATEDV